jgi:RNA polymerase sigma-70 factor (ECF subfamily)
MAEETSFDGLIARVRGGDPDAAAELVQRYEPTIRRAVRLRLADTRLKALLDSMDICQSVMASFFLRASLGQFQIAGPDELIRLLVGMARNKLAMQVRRGRAARRDYRRSAGNALEEHTAEAPAADPGRTVAARELLQEAQRRLTAEERQLIELRNDGCDWAAIAERLGSNPVALRKKLSRALERVSQEMGLGDELGG